MDNIVIREARRDDCKELRRLIQELADFEKMADDCKLTAHALERDGFDTKPPLFYCYVAEAAADGRDDNGVTKEKSEESSDLRETTENCHLLIGHVLYFFSYCSWKGRTIYLEDIYVTPKYRGLKIGSALFDAVVKKGCEVGCVRMDFVSLDWNPAQEFYKQKGAIDITSDENFNYFSIGRDAMEQLIARKSGGKKP